MSLQDDSKKKHYLVNDNHCHFLQGKTNSQDNKDDSNSDTDKTSVIRGRKKY